MAYKTVLSNIAPAGTASVPAYVPGRLVGVGFTLDVAGQIRLLASFSNVTFNAVSILDPVFKDLPAVGQGYYPLGRNMPVGGLTFTLTTPAQTAAQAVLFVYEDTPGG